jgi:hypothetical protein
MILTLKSIVYKYTGIYLAQKEEDAYLQSSEANLEYNMYAKYDGVKRLGHKTIKGIMIGGWQAHNGFCRPLSFVCFGSDYKIGRLVNNLCTLGLVLKWDFIFLKRRLWK